VTKQQTPEDARLELLKTLRGQEVACRTGLFRVPAVLSHDTSTGLIVFERIHEAPSLRETLASCDVAHAHSLMARLAAILATIHRSQAPTGMRMPEPYANAGSPAFLHGDCCLTNILYQPRSDGIVLIDWSYPPWLGVPFTTGPRAFDLVNLCLSFFVRRPFEGLVVPKPRRLTATFLETYLQHGGRRWLDEFPLVLRETLRLFLGHHGDFRRTCRTWCSWHSAWQGRRYLASLHRALCQRGCA